MKSPRQAEPVNHLVMVIHGVGDPAPGETLSLFARSIAEVDQPLNEGQDVVWLDEKSPNPEYVQRFATHVRQLDVGEERAVLAEVFWGDLSRVRRGLLGAAIGLVEILFGLQFVAYAAASQSGRAAQVLRDLGKAAARILHGPALAVTFVLAVQTLAMVGAELMWPPAANGIPHGQLLMVPLAPGAALQSAALAGLEPLLPPFGRGVFWTQAMMVGVSLLSITAAAIGSRITTHAGVQLFWEWVQITAAFVAGLMFVKTILLDAWMPGLAFTESVRPGLLWYCKILVWMLGLLWLGQMLVVMAMGVAWLAAQFRPAASRRALHAAFLLPAMIIGFWGLLLPMLWLLAAKWLRRVASLEEFDALFQQAVPMLGVQLMMAGVMVVVAAGVAIRYWIWRGNRKALANPALAIAPRLIVHPALQFSAGISTLAGVSLIAFLNVMQILGIRYEEHAAGRMLAEANRYMASLLLPIALLGFMLFQHLRPVLDIVLDVVNHFWFRPACIADSLDGDEYDIREATFEQGRLYFARRDAIHARIKNALTHFRDHVDGRPALTLISHSQGTMIAIEVLNDPELEWLNQRFSSVRLVTMGSPFTHLYQHYFSHLYPSLAEPHWQELRCRLQRWINICRADDFVGTAIRFPDFGNGPAPRCSNHHVGARGHLNYWSDVAVLKILHEELLVGERKVASPAPVRRAA